MIEMIVLLLCLLAFCDATFHCGISRQKREFIAVPLVKNGQRAQEGEFKWMAKIYARNQDGKDAECGGVLISDLHVLTAAHCVVSDGFTYPPANISLYLGVRNIHTKLQRYPVSEVIIQDEFNSSSFLYNDLAILTLQEPLNWEEHPSLLPICLPQESNIKHQYRKGIITGFGFTDISATSSSVLQKGAVNILSHEDCQLELATGKKNIRFRETNLCAKGITVNTCRGDSGGPLISNERGKGFYELIGIISWGVAKDRDDNDCHNKPAVYVRVAALLPWINEKTQGRARFDVSDFPVKEYKLFLKEPKKWEEARIACTNDGGHLAMVHTPEENTRLANMADVEIWIGATDEEIEGSWNWLNGEGLTSTYSNWGESQKFGQQPDNFEGVQDCLVINWDVLEPHSGKWDDAYCTDRKPFACQIYSTVEDERRDYFLETIDFKFYTIPKTWKEANRICHEEGGSLAIVNSEQKNKRLARMADVEFWLGATDIIREGVWTWENGDEVTFSNWGSHPYFKEQPDNWNNIQHCLVINWNILDNLRSGIWDDADCEATRPFVCEFHKY